MTTMKALLIALILGAIIAGVIQHEYYNRKKDW
jgi:hypothetical protein